MIFQGNLFPAHPQPHEDEILTSWLIRLAKANGLKLQAFSRIVFEGRPDLWNRDMDRKSYDWLIDELATRTGCSKEVIFGLTLESYKGKLFSHFHEVGILKWILPLNIYHRMRAGYGNQYCSMCLSEDDEPYFRKHWRVAFNTFCVKHSIMHRDRCPKCGYPVMFHRNELGKPNIFDGPELSICTTCGFDLRHSDIQQATFLDESSSSVFKDFNRSLQLGDRLTLDLDHLAVLRQLCKLINSKVNGEKLCNFLKSKLTTIPMEFKPNHLSFESTGIKRRHIITQSAIWVLSDLESVLSQLVSNRIVRFNALMKDMKNCPRWFYEICTKLNSRS